MHKTVREAGIPILPISLPHLKHVDNGDNMARMGLKETQDCDIPQRTSKINK